MRRGWSMVNWCFLSNEDLDSADHNIHCSWTLCLFFFLFSLSGVSHIFPRSVKDVLLSRHGALAGANFKMIWKLTPLCIFWITWKDGNSRTFDGVEIAFLLVNDVLLMILFYWMKGDPGWTVWPFLDILDNMGISELVGVKGFTFCFCLHIVHGLHPILVRQFF